MLRMLNATPFLMSVGSNRVLWLAGEYGSGKTSLAVALAYLLVYHRRADVVVSSTPCAFAVPLSLAPLSGFVAILDEAGVEWDNRSFGDRKQNMARKRVLAYLRKLNAYVILSSKVAPDVSFRALTVQQLWSFSWLGLPLEVFSYGYEDGVVGVTGWFGLHNRDWLWTTGSSAPSPKYGHDHVPLGFDSFVAHFQLAIASAVDDVEDPNECKPEDGEVLRRWFGMGHKATANSLQKSASWWLPDDLQGKDNSGGQRSDVLAGNVSSSVDIRGRGYHG